MSKIEKKDENKNFVEKMSPRLYGLICIVLGIGLGIITVKYIQDNGFFDFSEGVTISTILGTPILSIGTVLFIIAGFYYLVRGKWVENTNYIPEEDTDKSRGK